jgi:hypothetical protein
MEIAAPEKPPIKSVDRRRASPGAHPTRKRHKGVETGTKDRKTGIKEVLVRGIR